MCRLVIVLAVALVAACSSPPKPPVVDGSNRYPINSKATAEMLALRAELAQAWEQLREQGAATPTLPSSISQTVRVRFAFNSTKFHPTSEQLTALLPFLKNVARVEVRGRTDGQTASPANEQVALNRALSAKRFLVKQGVLPAVITVNYLSAGDYVSDNRTAAGRSQNRRVDIVVFNN
jgi:outer membrane protein OmpA-like peptidoglycan-associated protein